MSDSEGTALSEILEGEDFPPIQDARQRARRTSYRYFGVRYSAWGGEYKSYCYQCPYESAYGTRGKAVKSAIAHVTKKHGVNGAEER